MFVPNGGLSALRLLHVGGRGGAGPRSRTWGTGSQPLPPTGHCWRSGPRWGLTCSE